MVKKILLSGGGTMGSVSPLIAVYCEIKKNYPETEFLFVGTAFGPEKATLAGYQITFQAIASGKFRRYFSWQNFFDPIKILAGFFQALKIIFKFKPAAVMVAGSFVGVPVAWAAWFCRVPVLVHQQDIIPGLANKLMANIASRITVAFEISLKDFQFKKTVLTGNPVRPEFFSCRPESSREFFGLKKDLPTLLILGGGTGSQKINGLTAEVLPRLLNFCQVLHLCGASKKISFEAENYHQYEFLTNEMPEALCVADLVVSRAGLSTLSELIISAKAAVIIPIANSHQENNVQYFQKNNAVVALSEANLSNEMLFDVIEELIKNASRRQNLSRNIHKMMAADGAQKVARELLGLIK